MIILDLLFYSCVSAFDALSNTRVIVRRRPSAKQVSREAINQTSEIAHSSLRWRIERKAPSAIELFPRPSRIISHRVVENNYLGGNGARSRLMIPLTMMSNVQT